MLASPGTSISNLYRWSFCSRSVVEIWESLMPILVENKEVQFSVSVRTHLFWWRYGRVVERYYCLFCLLRLLDEVVPHFVSLMGSRSENLALQVSTDFRTCRSFTLVATQALQNEVILYSATQSLTIYLSFIVPLCERDMRVWSFQNHVWKLDQIDLGLSQFDWAVLRYTNV